MSSCIKSTSVELLGSSEDYLSFTRLLGGYRYLGGHSTIIGGDFDQNYYLQKLLLHCPTFHHMKT